MENDQTYKSAIIDPNTGNPVLHTGLVPKIEDYPPASDADWAELRTMLENFLRSGTDPRSPITCSVQSLVMLLRSCELTRQEADHYSGENPRGPELSGLTAAAVGQALCEALPHVRRQLDGRHEQDRADAVEWLDRWGNPVERLAPAEHCSVCSSPKCWGTCEAVTTLEEELAQETELVERTGTGGKSDRAVTCGLNPQTAGSLEPS